MPTPTDACRAALKIPDRFAGAFTNASGVPAHRPRLVGCVIAIAQFNGIAPSGRGVAPLAGA